MSQEPNYDEAADNLAMLDDAELEQDELPVVEHGQEDDYVEPEMDDPKWTAHVMKHILPDELFDGYPVVDGLRRVATKLLGPIISSKPKTVQAPSSSNGFCATVEWELVIMWERDPDVMG